jgi:hypothetical protein
LIDFGPAIISIEPSRSRRHNVPTLRTAKANISLFIVASLGWGAALGQAEQVLGQLGLELSEVSQVDSGAF